MKDDTNLRERSEGEIAGYRDVLNTIHSSYDAIPVTSNIILQLHQDMYKYISEKGGSWKSQDNIIGEILPNGEKFVRFKPVAASNTAAAMDSLCNFLNNEMQEENVEPLILIGSFILDFLCIHPFNDGKGNKSYRVEQAVKNIIGTFSKDDIRNTCPDVSDSTIDRVLRQLKKDNIIEVLGKGRSAKWKRLK